MRMIIDVTESERDGKLGVSVHAQVDATGSKEESKMILRIYEFLKSPAINPGSKATLENDTMQVTRIGHRN